jgi:hypothetical protein
MVFSHDTEAEQRIAAGKARQLKTGTIQKAGWRSSRD